MNTNKIFAGCFNLFRKWKVKKNQITLIEKLNTGGTGSLFEIKNECEKRGLPFHFNIITHADYEVSPRNLGGLIKFDVDPKSLGFSTCTYVGSDT